MARSQQPTPSDRMLRYVVESRTCHERLRDGLTQLAGIALLMMTRRNRIDSLQAPLDAARALLVPPFEALACLAVPTEARHHHHHLLTAADALRQAIARIETCLYPNADERSRSALTRSLRRATEHLRAAGALLPGFAMVDMAQACCACHAAPVRPTCLAG